MTTHTTHPVPSTGLQLRSRVLPSGELELSLQGIATPTPAADEVLVRIEATPINPSDIGLLFGAADMGTAKASGADSSTSPRISLRTKRRRLQSRHLLSAIVRSQASNGRAGS